MKEGVYYNPDEKVELWTFEESELRKAFRERKEYKERIDKAIELLEKYGNGTFDEDLLNILQGKDKGDE